MRNPRGKQSGGTIHPIWWFTLGAWLLVSAAIAVAPIPGPLQVLASFGVALVLAIATDRRLHRRAEARRRARRSA
jgi:membrane protein implicated in regulation of membrane protease activity